MTERLGAVRGLAGPAKCRKRTGVTSQGRIRVLEDSDAVFEAAIRNGVLSDDPASARYAGHYMYLFHDAHGTAWFKHRDSRVCVTMRERRCSGSRTHDRG